MKFLDEMVPDKWVAAALPPKTRCRAVAWDELHIVTQGEQVLADTGNQVLVVAPGEEERRHPSLFGS